MAIIVFNPPAARPDGRVGEHDKPQLYQELTPYTGGWVCW